MNKSFTQKTTLPFFCVILFVSFQSALADTITVEFYTSGIFGNGSNSITLGTGNGANQLNVTFDGIGSAASHISMTNTDGQLSETTLGTFSVDWGKEAQSAVLSDTFTLTIHQYLPGTGTDTIVGSVLGTINIASTGDAKISFAGDNFGSISTDNHEVFYTLAYLDSDIFYLPDPTTQSTNHNQVTKNLEAFISHDDLNSGNSLTTVNHAPEPTSLLLLGTGLGVLGLAAYRRRGI